MGMGPPVSYQNWHTFDKIDNRGKSFQFQRMEKLFQQWLKKYSWLVYNRDGNFMYCKICMKAKKSNGMSIESQGRNVQNTALFRHTGLQEHHMANLYLHAICVQGYGTHLLGPGT